MTDKILADFKAAPLQAPIAGLGSSQQDALEAESGLVEASHPGEAHDLFRKKGRANAGCLANPKPLSPHPLRSRLLSLARPKTCVEEAEPIFAHDPGNLSLPEACIPESLCDAVKVAIVLEPHRLLWEVQRSHRACGVPSIPRPSALPHPPENGTGLFLAEIGAQAQAFGP